jgi:diguanylate cyclase (GGDEF)-like protein
MRVWHGFFLRQSFLMSPKFTRVLALHGSSEALIHDVASSGFGPFRIHWLKTVQALIAAAGSDHGPAGAVLTVSQAEALGPALERCATNAAIVLLSDLSDRSSACCEDWARWFGLGVQDILTPQDSLHGGLARRLRAALERHSLCSEIRRAYATDLGTGLPHEQQLIEHMSHLIALREREPASMAVLVLRIEGLATVEARAGAQAVAVLRRKLAVRLRSGVRASDVVAALDGQLFGVLLASVASPEQAASVGRKLLTSLHAPFNVGGHDLTVSTALGIGQYPQDGAQPAALIQHAISAARVALAEGRAGFANFIEGTTVPRAANEE